MKPTAAHPKIIMAQVEGSGTASTVLISTLSKAELKSLGGSPPWELTAGNSTEKDQLKVVSGSWP
jgi:hypothetical protein